MFEYFTYITQLQWRVVTTNMQNVFPLNLNEQKKIFKGKVRSLFFSMCRNRNRRKRLFISWAKGLYWPLVDGSWLTPQIINLSLLSVCLSLQTSFSSQLADWATRERYLLSRNIQLPPLRSTSALSVWSLMNLNWINEIVNLSIRLIIRIYV